MVIIIINIIIFTYDDLTSITTKAIKKVEDNDKDDVNININVVEAVFSDVLQYCNTKIDSEETNILIAGGANYKLLKNKVDIPVVNIKIEGFDILSNINKASKISNKIIYLRYKKILKRLNKISNILNVNFEQITYKNKEDIDNIVKQYSESNQDCVFIGPSATTVTAKKYNKKNILVYTEKAVLDAINTAYQIGYTQIKEKRKTQQIKTIIDYVDSGIIAVDKKGKVTIYNPKAEDIVGLNRKDVIGKKVDKCISNTRLLHVLNSRNEEINKIQNINNKKILTNRIPIIINDEIYGVVATFQNIKLVQQAEEKVRQELYKDGFNSKYVFSDIKGISKDIKETKKLAKIYSKQNSNILITGESGTGKELFAHSIHNNSSRKNKPFVAINCGALPDNLLESELFGFKEGAFTGARKGGKKGVFEMAHKGTIFLDEIGDISFKIQVRLLRVIQEMNIMRIGGNELIPIDSRIICATNKNLWKLVKNNKFREDLYYRINVLKLEIPPLRKRKEDLEITIKTIFNKKNKNWPKGLKESIPKLISHFNKYDWPGNIRELENVLERYFVLFKEKNKKETMEEFLKKRCFFDKKYNSRSTINNFKNSSLKKKMKKVEKDIILDVLKNTNNNKEKAAKKLNISRTTLWRKLTDYY